MKWTSSSAWSKGWIGWRDGLTRREVAAHPHPRKVRQLDKTASCYQQKQSDFIVSGEEIVVLFFRFGKGSKNIVVFAISPRTPWNFFPFYVQCASTSQCFTHLFQCSMCICYSMVQYLMCTRYGSALLRKVEERARSFAVASRPWEMNNWTGKLKPTPPVILVNNDYIR